MSDRKDDAPTLEELAAALDGVRVASSDVAACLLPECPNLCQRPGRGRGRPQMFCSATCRAKYAYRRGQLDHALTVVEDVADELAEQLPFARSSEAERLRQLVIEAHQNLEWQLARFSRDRVHRRRNRPGPADPGQPHLRALYTLTGDSPDAEELAAIEAEEAAWRRFQLFWRRDDGLPTRRPRIPVGRPSFTEAGAP
ncbi:hypothetical protein [Cellulomonas hominis]|uniref:hypothetical protein n=1 Tax=Cellulomonas hominis TaxID=156981 RepID=UPI001443A18D|nr:hypothetical protein [Cellulomonas hominis]NKY08843.1 hypothetical protein [Cellulomonas hominis]